MQMLDTPEPRWWTFGYVWFLIAGPALVIAACGVTLWLAITRPDPVLAHNADSQHSAQMPAELARNHAQTGVPVARH
jgi:hypothetical protein